MKKKTAAIMIAFCVCIACITGCSEEITDWHADRSAGAEMTSVKTETTTAAQTETTTTTTSQTTTVTTTTTTAATTTTKTETATEATVQTAFVLSDDSDKLTLSTKAAETTKATTTQTTAVSRITGSSSNVDFYKQRLFVLGDSVASGYAAYGKIPYDHSVAKVSVSIRSAAYQIPLAKAQNPSLVLTSMGMNDYGLQSHVFAKNYMTFLQDLRKALPHSVIVVGAITPTAQVNRYPHITIDIVKRHNAALKHLVETMGDDRIVFFDAFSVVVSDNGMYMQNKYAAADGLHLQGPAYDVLLSAMAVTLDQKGVKDKVLACEAGR